MDWAFQLLAVERLIVVILLLYLEYIHQDHHLFIFLHVL